MYPASAYRASGGITMEASEHERKRTVNQRQPGLAFQMFGQLVETVRTGVPGHSESEIGHYSQNGLGANRWPPTKTLPRYGHISVAWDLSEARRKLLAQIGWRLQQEKVTNGNVQAAQDNPVPWAGVGEPWDQSVLPRSPSARHSQLGTYKASGPPWATQTGESGTAWSPKKENPAFP